MSILEQILCELAGGCSRLSRRKWLRSAASVAAGSVAFGNLRAWAGDAAGPRRPRRSCIVLWMAGGPSQIDTFDPKPGHANGGPFREIETAVPGIRISEHLPKLAERAKHLAIVRSMSTKEGDHQRATDHLHTGYQRQGSIEYPSLGSLVAKENHASESVIPGFVSLAPNVLAAEAYKPGFLGSQFAPLILRPAASNTGTEAQGGAQSSLRVEHLEPSAAMDRAQIEARVGLLAALEQDFAARQPDPVPQSHRAAYDRAIRLMDPTAAKAFDLADEPAAVREAYGGDPFGQGCLLARRLVERGAGFVEVALGAGQSVWDTHDRNFPRVQQLSGGLDQAWSMLIDDLDSRGLLDSTLIVWMGEFGRTPKINNNEGRDHFPNAWSTVLAGGGIRGGQVIGCTSADGMVVEDRPVSVPDFMATICLALGIDPAKENIMHDGRPVPLVERGANPIREILANR